MKSDGTIPEIHIAHVTKQLTRHCAINQSQHENVGILYLSAGGKSSSHGGPKATLQSRIGDNIHPIKYIFPAVPVGSWKCLWGAKLTGSFGEELDTLTDDNFVMGNKCKEYCGKQAKTFIRWITCAKSVPCRILNPKLSEGQNEKGQFALQSRKRSKSL